MTLTFKVYSLQSFIDKSFGLLRFAKPQPVYLQTRFGIHTFFMRYSIDVLILDKDNKVTRLKENLKPNRIFVWPVIFNQVIEFPNGEIKKRKIKLGDRIITSLKS